MILADFTEDCFEPVSHNRQFKKRVVLREGQCGNLTQLARSVFPQGQRVESHCHRDMMEIFIVRSGTGRIIIDGKSFDLKKDSCIVVEPGESHELINTGESQLTMEYFSLAV